MYIYKNVGMDKYAYTDIHYKYIYVYTDICVQIYTYIHTCVYTYTCVYV